MGWRPKALGLKPVSAGRNQRPAHRCGQRDERAEAGKYPVGIGEQAAAGGDVGRDPRRRHHLVGGGIADPARLAGETAQIPAGERGRGHFVDQAQVGRRIGGNALRLDPDRRPVAPKPGEEHSIARSVGHRDPDDEPIAIAPTSRNRLAARARRAGKGSRIQAGAETSPNPSIPGGSSDCRGCRPGTPRAAVSAGRSMAMASAWRASTRAKAPSGAAKASPNSPVTGSKRSCAAGARTARASGRSASVPPSTSSAWPLAEPRRRQRRALAAHKQGWRGQRIALLRLRSGPGEPDRSVRPPLGPMGARAPSRRGGSPFRAGPAIAGNWDAGFEADLEHVVGHRHDLVDRAEDGPERIAAFRRRRGPKPRHDLLGGDPPAAPIRLAEPERIAQAVVGDDPALGQRGLDLAAEVEPDQALGDGFEKDCGRRIERPRLGLERRGAPPITLTEIGPVSVSRQPASMSRAAARSGSAGGEASPTSAGSVAQARGRIIRGGASPASPSSNAEVRLLAPLWRRFDLEISGKRASSRKTILGRGAHHGVDQAVSRVR